MSNRYARCSWCFEKTNHELAQRNFIRRNVYLCTRCLNRTLKCRYCDAMTRGHGDWDDEKCAVHDGSIKNWRQRSLGKKSAWCSWCFEKTSHRLVQKNSVRRDVYECEACGRRTLPCLRCDGKAFARGHGTWDDNDCIVCDQTIESWRSPENNRKEVSLKSWCSWCLNYSTHTLEQVREIRRNIYICESCFQKTLSCKKCGSGLARAGAGLSDTKCSVCKKEFDTWSAAQKKGESIFLREHNSNTIKKELSRKSKFKDEALKAGMIRPFLLLVSMHPAERNQVAASLGWTLAIQEYFGDAHQEALHIINKHRKGIQARTNECWESLNPVSRNCNWFEVLHRTSVCIFEKSEIGKKSFRKSINACRSPGDSLCANKEEEFISKVSMIQQRVLTQEQQLELDQLLQSDEVKELSKNMEKSGLKNKELVQHSINLVYRGIKMGGMNTYITTIQVAAWMNRNIGTNIMMLNAVKNVTRFAKMANVIGWAWLGYDVLDLLFGSSHGRLFLAVNKICTQRLFLASEGIPIEQYYT